jgi:hypothetical protein
VSLKGKGGSLFGIKPGKAGKMITMTAPAIPTTGLDPMSDDEGRQR